MICIYDKNTAKGNFDNNGLCILDECIQAAIDSSLNGEYSLELEYPAASYKAKYLEELNIIKADEQLFRIYKVERIQAEILKVKIWARHIFYDLAFYFIESAKIINANALEALTMTIPPELQAIYSFIAPEQNIAPFAAREVNAVDAMFKLIEVYGGELLRNNFNISIIDKLGEENGISIKYGKNIKGLTVIEDTSEICTRIYAVGSGDLLLPERYIEVQGADGRVLPFPITRRVEFSECKDVDSLRAKATEYAKKSALPKLHISIDFLELSKTQEYKSFENLTKLNIGDIANVTHERLGLTTKLRVIRKKVDLINPVNTKVELGDPLATIIEKLDTSKLLDEINKAIAGSLSSVIIKKNSDSLTINTSKYPAMVIGFSTKADTNLNLNLTMMGKASESCTLSILFSLDGVNYEFKPVQKLSIGDNVIGFSLPMPQVIAGSHTFIVEMWLSNGNFIIEKNNLQITIEGRDLEGGLSASLPRAEVIYTFLYSLFFSKLNNYPFQIDWIISKPPDNKLQVEQVYNYSMFKNDGISFYSDSGIRELTLTVMGIIEQFSREKCLNYFYDEDWIDWDSDFDKNADGTYESYSRATIKEPVLLSVGGYIGELSPGVIYSAQLSSRDTYNNIVSFSPRLIEIEEG